MKLAILAVLLLICALLQYTSAADPCVFTLPDGEAYWLGDVSPIKQCFNSIPYSKTRAQNTLTIARQLFDYYAFTDIVKDSGAPWNQKVDVMARLNQIEATTYTSDYAFQTDVANLFNQLNDAHTQYTLPKPYSNVYVTRPFGIRVANDNGVLKFYVTQSNYASASTVRALFGNQYDPYPYYGLELTAIDRIPILDWFKNFTDRYVSYYKDQGIRFNAALKKDASFNAFSLGYFSINDLNDRCVMTINGTDVQAPYVVRFFEGLNSTDDAIAQIDKPQPKKRSTTLDKYSSQPDIYKRRKEILHQLEPDYNGNDNNGKRFDYSSLNTQAVQKRSDQQVSDQYILSVKRGNSNMTTIATDYQSVWWGTYTTMNNTVIPYLRIASFSANDAGFFMETLASFSNYTSNNQIDRVIVDVSGNGGGDICLGYVAVSIFSDKFRGLKSFELNDIRITDRNTDLAQNGFFKDNYLRPSDGQPFSDLSWYQPRTVTRGGQSSTVNQKLYFPSGCLQFFDYINSITGSRFPADPIIISDGTCGSTCSIFTSKFVEYGVGRVVTYGGFPGTVMDTASFGGGNIQTWLNFANMNVSSLKYPPLIPTTSASYSFTHHEVYSGTTVDVPREFRKLPGQYHAYFYDLITSTDPASDAGKQALADLYETAVVAWTITPTPVAAPQSNRPVSVTSQASIAASSISQIVLLLAVFFYLC